MGILRQISDGILDSVSPFAPTLNEMRWNQLQREYEHEKYLESKNSRYDYGCDYDFKVLEVSARHSEREDVDFTPDLDAKYSDMLKKAKKLAAPKGSVIELPSNVSAGDMDVFLCEVEEHLKTLLEYDFEFDDDFYEYDSIECNARDYNESGYDTKTEAKADCRQSIKSAIEDVKSQYESEKSYLISAAESELSCLKLYISSIQDEFCKIFIDSANQSLCDDATKEYIIERFNEVYKQWNIENSNIDSDIDNEYSIKLAKVIKSYFKTEEADLSKQTALLEMCIFSQSWRGDYKYSTDDACKTLVKEHMSVIKYAIRELPAIMFRKYEELRFERASRLFKIIYMLK